MPDNIRGLLTPGNIDLVAQPKVKNPDGSISTVDSSSYGIDGKEVLLPSVTQDGRHLKDPKDIVNEYRKTGRHLGIFDTPENATSYASKLHDNYAAGKYEKAKPSMSDTRIAQADFLAQLKAKHPELKDFNDNDIMKRVVELRPDVKDRIRTPDQAAAAEQARLELQSHSIVNPETWKNHPTAKKFAESVLDAAPGAGAILGGLAATPETFGGGAILGGALGAGAGRGFRDIASQALGLEDTSPMEKAKNIGVDTAIAGVTPGLMTAARHPIQTLRMGAGALNDLEGAMLPRGLRQYLTPSFLEDFAKGGKSIADPFTRPPWQSGISVKDAELVGPSKSPFSEGEIVRDYLPASKTSHYQPSSMTSRKALTGAMESEAQSPSAPRQALDQQYRRLNELTAKAQSGKMDVNEIREASRLNRILNSESPSFFERLPPDFTPVGSESRFNAARSTGMAKSPEDAVYELARSKFGMGQDLPHAEFLGLHENGEPLFNVVGGPSDKSTVTAKTLAKMGLTVPEVPAGAQPMKGDQLREIAMSQKRSSTPQFNPKGQKGKIGFTESDISDLFGKKKD